jgi:glycosyltransferase involved in cell wall biosynthesis
MAFYGRELAARLPVASLATDVNLRSADRFGTPAVSVAAARMLAEDARFVRRLRRIGAIPHLTHHHTLRYGLLLDGPFIASVHDLIRFSDASGRTTHIAPLNARDRAGVRLDAVAATRAAAVLTPSATVARDVVAQLGVPAQDVAVVPLGVDHARFRPVGGPRPLAAPYVLFVGSEHPRKEVPTLLRAFALLKASGRFGALKLVKVGDPGDDEAPFAVEARRVLRETGLEGEVVFTGRVSDEELPPLVRARRGPGVRVARRGLRAAGGSRRWRAGARSSRRPRGRCPRSSGTPACSSRRASRVRWRPPWRSS